MEFISSLFFLLDIYIEEEVNMVSFNSNNKLHHSLREKHIVSTYSDIA
jgi:hypothetical protein